MTARNRVGDILLQAKVIDEMQLRAALASQQQWGGRLTLTVAELKLAPERQVVEALAAALRVPRVDLKQATRDEAALAKLDASVAEARGVFPVSLQENGRLLLLAMADPSDLGLQDEVAHLARARVKPLVAGEREIQEAIRKHYRNSGASETPRTNEIALDEPSAGPESAPLVHVEEQVSGQPDEAVDRPRTDRQAPLGACAAELLDELLATSPDVLTDDERSRLAQLRANQAACANILRAVAELVAERGYAPLPK